MIRLGAFQSEERITTETGVVFNFSQAGLLFSLSLSLFFLGLFLLKVDSFLPDVGISGGAVIDQLSAGAWQAD